MFLPAFFFSSAHRRGMFLPEWVLINTGLRKTTTIDDKDKTKRSNKKQNTKREPLRLAAVFMGARSNTVYKKKMMVRCAQLPRVDESRRPAMSVLDVAAIASSRYWGWNDSRAPLPPSSLPIVYGLRLVCFLKRDSVDGSVPLTMHPSVDDKEVFNGCYTH